MVFVRSDPNRVNGLSGPPPYTGSSDPVSSTVCPYPVPASCCPLLPSASLPFLSPFAARSGGSANSVGLLRCGQRPDPPRRPVGERHRDHLLRLARQHPGQPRIRVLAAPDRVPNNRHGSRDQEPSQISLAQRTGGSQNPGRKTSKVIQDCTICASCRCTGLCWIVPRKRVNRFEWREFASY